jgi:hypothetical protein
MLSFVGSHISYPRAAPETGPGNRDRDNRMGCGAVDVMAALTVCSFSLLYTPPAPFRISAGKGQPPGIPHIPQSRWYEDLRTTFHRWYPGMTADPEPAEDAAA